MCCAIGDLRHRGGDGVLRMEDDVTAAMSELHSLVLGVECRLVAVHPWHSKDDVDSLQGEHVEGNICLILTIYIYSKGLSSIKHGY